jgi:tetratricopeptide (TPR) repeat protein
MTAEYEVLMTAVGQAIESRHVELSWKLASTLQNYQHATGQLQDWAGVMRLALAAAKQAGDDRGRVRAERSLAGAYLFMGDGQKALAHLQNVRHLTDALGWVDESAHVERNLGDVFRHGTVDLPRDLSLAIKHYTRAIELGRDKRPQQGMAAYAMTGLAECHMRQGDHERSVGLLNRARQMHRDRGDINGEGQTLAALAETCFKLGRLDDAAQYVLQAIELHVEGQHRLQEISDLRLLGEIRRAQNQPGLARAAWHKGRTLAVRVGLTAEADDLQARLDRLNT